MNQVTTQMQLVTQAALNPHQVVEGVAFFKADGTPLLFQSAPDTGSTVLLTGYAIAGAAAAVAAADSVNIAIGKLEKRVALLEA